jgi:putative spermidine/putrescine transport system permease protein
MMAITPSDESSRRLYERREHLVPWLLLAPALLLVCVLLLAPLLWLAGQSVWDNGFTFENYRRLVVEPIYWRTFALTFRLSLEVSVATLLLGYPVAYAAVMLPRRWGLVVLGLVVVPFWTSILVRSYAWLVLLQRTGVVNKLLQALGLTNAPLMLVNNEIGTTIAMIHILLPFMVLPLFAAMEKIPLDLVRAAASLGGTPFYAFRRIFLPLSMPGVVAGAVLVFVLSLGFYVTPELLGGGRTLLVSMLISRNIQLYDHWGAASAISVVLLGTVLAILALARLLVPSLRSMEGS